MSLFKKILISLSLVIVVTSAWIFYRYRSNARLYTDKEYNHDIPGFQIEKAASAKVYATRDAELIKNLSKAETQSLLRIFLDSANYRWGELGTPIYDRVIIYYDSTGSDIGMTRFSHDGQTDTDPSIESQTKFGLLKIELHGIHAIIEKSSEH